MSESSVTAGKCSESGEIKLQGVAWKIELCKRTTEKEKENENDKEKIDVVDIFLVSSFTDETSKWSCEAKANFVLKSVRPEHKEIAKQLETKKFTIANPREGHKWFVNWDDLKNNYSEGDVATFEITLEIEPPTRIAQLEQTSTTFYFKVPDVHRYTSPNGTSSNDVDLRGVNWHYKAMKAKNAAGKDTFAIYLYANQDDMDLYYQWQANTTITLISSKKEKNHSLKFGNSYHWRNLVYGLTAFIEWDNFINKDNGYVISGGAIFKIDLAVQEPKLLSP